jgi:hypothetical protein
MEALRSEKNEEIDILPVAAADAALSIAPSKGRGAVNAP